MAEIKVYGASWCPDCRRVKAFLKDRGIEVQEINIEDDPDAEDLDAMLLRACGWKTKW